MKPCIVTIKRGRKVRYLRVRRNPDAPAGVAVTEVKAPTPTAPPVAPEKKTNPWARSPGLVRFGVVKTANGRWKVVKKVGSHRFDYLSTTYPTRKAAKEACPPSYHER